MLFLAVALYNRLDFTITKDERWQEEQARDKARGILQKLLTIWECEFWGRVGEVLQCSHSHVLA
jgi:hypothetical protein